MKPVSTPEPSPFLPEDTPADPQDARRSNRNRIMRTIITRGPATRAELARRTGLSRPTVSVIANELLTTGVLMEGERISSGGAPGTLLEIARDTGVTVAADLSIPGRVRIAAVSVSGHVGPAEVRPASTTDEVNDALIEFSRGVGADATLGVALGVPAWVDSTGEWTDGEDRGGVDSSLLVSLRKTLRTPVFALNSTDAKAIADLRDSPPGLGAQATVSLDTRISAGLVIGGRLRSGVSRPAGDISHVVPGTRGPICPVCGHACLNATMMPLTTDHSARTQNKAAQALGTVMAPIAAAVELGEIVLAGFPTPVAALVAQETHTQMASRMLSNYVPRVRVSARGEDSVLLGAAAMMLYRRLG